MKKLSLIILFITGFNSYSQTATIHFYYGSNEMLGAEILTLLRGTDNTYLGGGFSGALNKRKAVGEWKSGDITANDLQYKTGYKSEQWCSIYAKSSFGYLGKFLITFKGGLAVYDRKMEFTGENRTTLEPYYYNKHYEVNFRPMGGIGAMYQVCKNYGIEASYDSFNGATIGFNAIFD